MKKQSHSQNGCSRPFKGRPICFGLEGTQDGRKYEWNNEGRILLERGLGEKTEGKDKGRNLYRKDKGRKK